MVQFRHTQREIQFKVVYYGPALGGKTTNLEALHELSDPEGRTQVVSMKTSEDRTLFFDFLPMELGTILGMKLRVQLYTVPGQVFYDATRRIVLRGSDGVVFVADSQKLMMDANWESLENMKKNLVLNNMNPDILPLVFQYNKRDLPNLATPEELDQALNWRGVPHFEAVATVGKGVNETVRKIIEMVIRRLHEQEANLKHPQRSTEVPPSPAPPVPPQSSEPSLSEQVAPVPVIAPVGVTPAVEDTSEELAGVEVETEFSVGPGAVPPEPGPPDLEKGMPVPEADAAPERPPAPSDFPLIEMPATVEPLPELEEATGDRPMVIMEPAAGGGAIPEDLPESAVQSEEAEILPEAAVEVEDLPVVAVPEDVAVSEQLPEFAVEVEVSGGLEELPPPAEVVVEEVGAGDDSVEVAEEGVPSGSILAEMAVFSGALDDLLQRLRGFVSEVEDLKARMTDFEDRVRK